MPSFRAYGILFDGIVAVLLFFVLSGFSLSVNYFASLQVGDPAADLIVRRMALARYSRLALPSLAACLLMYALSKAGLNYYAHIPNDIKPDWWAWAYRNESVRFLQTLRFSLYDVFLPGAFIPTVPYEGPYLITNLWTMSIEFVGSILVFLYVLSVRDSSWRIVLTLAATIALVQVSSYYAFFFAGALIADVFLRVKSFDFPQWTRLTAVAAVIMLFALGRPDEFSWQVIYCTALVFLISMSKPCRSLFGYALFRYLGRISFALYLVHMPIVVSLQSYLYLTLSPSLSLNQTIALAGSVSIVASFVTAHFFTYIDQFAIMASRRFARSIVG